MNRPRIRTRVVCSVIAGFGFLACSATAKAHFLWLASETTSGTTEIHAFLSEPPAPDLPEFLRHIEKARFSADGQTLAVDRGENTFVIRLPATTPRVVDGECDLGVMTRGTDTFRLKYTARVQFGPIEPGSTMSGAGLRAVLLKTETGGARVFVTFDGRPAPGASVKAYISDGTVEQFETDAEGRLDDPRLVVEGTALLIRWPDGVPGEADGKSFAETRHYATLTIAEMPTDRAHSEPASKPVPFALLPEPVNSFGGAVLGEWLFVYSGHIGTTHRYHTGTTNPHFRRLNLRDRQTWEELPCGPALQGVALVAHEGSLYRVGGMLARNTEGDPHDLISTDEVARFDPISKTWTQWPKLPEPRSTHDAAVLGDHLYVVGGWSMQGGESTNSYFLDDALRLDLRHPDSGWETLPTPPFRRRALAVAAAGGRIYVVGGLTEDGKTVRDVDIFDPSSGRWSKGPELPGSSRQGFGPSAFGIDGRLYASGADGVVYRLASSGESWEAIGKLAAPRITHRLLPGLDGDVLLVGGSSSGKLVPTIESIPRDGN